MNVSRETCDWGREWRAVLRSVIREGSLPFTAQAMQKLTAFAEAILDENPILHLVSQKEPHQEVVKQIIDSASICRCFSLLPGCCLLDIGSGAGFPGVILKLLFPKIELISLDSSPKKIAFQKRICDHLRIGARFVEGDFRRVDLHSCADIVIVKAFGAHAAIVRKSRDWLRSGGALVFMEGTRPEPSIEKTAAKYHDLGDVSILPYRVPEIESVRHLSIIYKK